MIYPYECNKCGVQKDIVKSMHDASRVELCDECEIELTRVWTSPFITGAKVESAEYNPGLGIVTTSAYDRSEKAKRLGVVEIGNDYKGPEDIAKKFDSDRNKKLEKAWEDV